MEINKKNIKYLKQKHGTIKGTFMHWFCIGKYFIMIFINHNKKLETTDKNKPWIIIWGLA